MELCDWSLVDYCLEKCGEINLNLPDALSQMASGLAFIHDSRMIHGSIKPSNIMIRKSPNPENPSFQLKLADFGIRTFWPDTDYTMGSEKERKLINPENYFAPEILKKDIETPTCFSDIFALGCVFFNSQTRGEHPFATGPRPVIIASNIANGVHSLKGKHT